MTSPLQTPRLLRSPIGLALAATTLLLAAVALARHIDPLPEGLRATYFSDMEWTVPVRGAIDSRPSTDSLLADWEGQPPEKFSATWTGAFIVLRAGTYSFATDSDDGSWVYVDGQLVVDNGGSHSSRRVRGTAPLAPGVHVVLIRYFQSGAQLDFDLLWGGSGPALDPVPSWALFPRPRSFTRLLASVILRCAARAAVWLWTGTLLLVICLAVLRAVPRWVRALTCDVNRMVLAAIVMASVVLNVAGIGWGLPSVWAGDEMTPDCVLVGISQGFSHGWFDRYPPLDFYVLSAVFSPWLLLKSAGWIHPSGQVEAGALLLLSRLVSIAAGAGTLIAVYLCGALAFSRRTGLFAAAAMALVCPFVYYAKTANPEASYVFWFSLSLVFYLRLLRDFSYRDCAFFGMAATAAICTKDQAYGLYAAAPLVFVYVLWRSKREAGVRRPILSALVDRRLLFGGLAAAALFLAIHNVAFNAGGFLDHVRDVTGPGQQGYQIVDRTVDGQLTLLGLSVDLDRRSWGWPMWIFTIAGWVLAIRDEKHRRAALALTLLVIGYYIAFIDVILYVFDRYLLPVCVVQALLAGFAMDAVLRMADQQRRAWYRGLVAATFAYTLLYAATVDVLMIRDSRYTVERWLRAHNGGGGLVGRVFPLAVLPRLDDFRSMDIKTIDDLRQVSPSYYVLNADYARCVERDSDLGQLVAGLQQQSLGYRRVFSYRTPAPWPWLPAGHSDLVGPRLETRVFSTLRSLNPEIEIYQRTP